MPWLLETLGILSSDHQEETLAPEGDICYDLVTLSLQIEPTPTRR